MDTTLHALLLVGSALFPAVFLTSAFLLRTWVGIHSRAVCTTVAMRITSIFNAIVASTMGWYIVIHCYQDFLYARCWIVDKYMCFGIPYMLYDMGAMYASFHVNLEEKHSTILSKSLTFLPFIKKEKVLLFHHLMVALVAFPLALFYRNGKGEFFIGCMLLTELSTPFVNLRGILKKEEFQDLSAMLRVFGAGRFVLFPTYNTLDPLLIPMTHEDMDVFVNRKNTVLYHTNNTIILIVFFLCRIFIFPIIFWVYSWDQEFSWIKVPFRIPWHCTFGCSVIILFQFMWYYMFARSMWRGFERQRFEGKLQQN